MNLLLLEDNVTDASLTKRSLENSISGCSVEIATTVKQAKELLKKGATFDIALLDMQLPDGTGLDMLMEIRISGIKLPVIMITGSGNEEMATTVLKAGADDYLVKRQGYVENLPGIINYAVKNFHQRSQELKEIIDVLYIEHHSSDIDLTLRHMNQFAPYIRIDFVATAEEALEQMDMNEAGICKCKVILLDYLLPGINALEFIKIIRQERKLDVPIIMVTGQGSEDVALQALKLGANDYMVKRENYLYRLPLAILNTYQHSELIKKQAALVESESKYRLLADNSGDVIFVLDKDLNYTYISPAVKTLRGFEPEEVIRQNMNETLTPGSFKKATKILHEILAKNHDDSGTGSIQKMIELEMVCKDKTTVWTEVKVSLITNDDNKMIGILGVSRDITEKKKEHEELIAAKEHAEESDRLKSAFLANMSHEIRTPMNGILGFTELLLEPDLSSEQKEAYIKIVHQSGQRMLNTLNDIVEISKIEAGIVTINLTEVDVQLRLKELIRFFTPEVTKKGLKLTLENKVPKAVTIIKTDQNKLDSIFTNLIKNAIKYTLAGEIRIGCMVRENWLEFYVKDTGIGIPAERQQAVFERFTKADILDIDARQGSGLGLAIAKAYVEMLGGEIRVESIINEGSTFFFTLPLNGQSPEKFEKKENTIQNEKSSQINGLQIVIAEDDEISALYLKTILKSVSSKIILTKKGNETVEACRNNPGVDLVLMDIQMPDMNGYEATRRIREFNKDVVIIAQTAYALAGDRKKSLDAGCNDYISKPIKKLTLMEKIQKYF